jgi:hypothetical protein
VLPFNKLAQLPTFVSKIDFLPLFLGGECAIIRISFKPHSVQDDGAFFIDYFFRLLKKMGESFYTLTLLLERAGGLLQSGNAKISQKSNIIYAFITHIMGKMPNSYV